MYRFELLQKIRMKFLKNKGFQIFWYLWAIRLSEMSVMLCFRDRGWHLSSPNLIAAGKGKETPPLLKEITREICYISIYSSELDSKYVMKFPDKTKLGGKGNKFYNWLVIIANWQAYVKYKNIPKYTWLLHNNKILTIKL